MEGINGLEIARKLPADTCFVFTTAYLNYTLEGFNLDAVDYLHKPFSYERFQQAFTKALRRIEYNKAALADRFIIVKQDYNNVTIPLKEIVYVEAMEGYSKIFRTTGICTVARGTLKTMLGILPAKEFVRIHRSYAVALRKVSGFSRQEVRMTTGTVLPIGRQYASEVTRLLMGRAGYDQDRLSGFPS